MSALDNIWRGETVAVFATGASLTPAIAEGTRSARAIVVKGSLALVPWAEMLVCHDLALWTQEFLAFKGIKVSGQAGAPGTTVLSVMAERVELRPGHVLEVASSGILAVRAAALTGPKRIELYGFDGGRGHWQVGKSPRDDHLAAACTVALSRLVDELRARGIEVVFQPGTEPPLLLRGFAGLGDNIHMRAVARVLAKRHTLSIETPWPQLFRDLRGVNLAPSSTSSPFARANQERSSALYGDPAPAYVPVRRCSYTPETVRRCGSVVAAMGEACGVPPEDFTLEVPKEWRRRARKLLPRAARFIVYRPLTARRDRPLDARTPDPLAYATLFDAVRGGRQVVSVARLGDSESLVGPQLDAEHVFHAGELDVETMAGLFAEAELVFSPPGFATALAQAVRTPAITIFGGYEDAKSFSWGAASSRWLPIEPVRPCNCWRPDHDCDKRIDMPRALEAIRGFTQERAAA